MLSGTIGTRGLELEGIFSSSLSGSLGFVIRLSLCMRSSDLDLHKKQKVSPLQLPHIVMVSHCHCLHSEFMDFIFKRLESRNQDGSLQIMYSIHGRCLGAPYDLPRLAEGRT